MFVYVVIMVIWYLYQNYLRRHTWAIPDPIRPPPITVTCLIALSAVADAMVRVQTRNTVDAIFMIEIVIFRCISSLNSTGNGLYKDYANNIEKKLR